MRANRLVVGSSLLFVVVACSSATPSTTSNVVLPPSGAADPVAPSTPGATNANALVYFDGAVDTVRGVMNLVVRDAAGAIKSEATLPYGDNPGQVYMHTCTSAYNSGTHQLTGNVQAVNLMSGTVTSLNAVVDSVSVTGVTLASGSGAGGSSGIIASYGSVAVNTPNCASTQPWAFQNLAGNPSFTFKGHADGTAPSGPVQTFQFTDGVNNPAPGALLAFFQGLGTVPTTSFFLAGVNTPASTNSEYCLERADFYVSNYIAFNASGTSVSSGNWNKYLTTNGGASWSASDTSPQPNIFAAWGPTSWAIEWGAFGRNIAYFGPTNPCGTNQWSYDSSCAGPNNKVFTIKVGSTRAATCGF